MKLPAVVMSKAKKKPIISDQINEILKPKELTEENEETEARFEEFTELDIDNRLSDIRKQTAKHLSELDSKYKGKQVSRRELEDDNGSSGGSDLDESDNEENLNNIDGYATDSDEENIGSDDESESEQEQSGSEQTEDDDNSSGENSEDDPGDDYDLSQFTKSKTDTPSASSFQKQDKTELLKSKSVNDEIKKGICVQNQLKMWEKLLEVRIKSQKMLLTANSFPDFDGHLELSSINDSSFANKIDSTCEGLYGLLGNLLDLQKTLVEKFPESKDLLKEKKRKSDQEDSGGFLKRSKLAEYADRIEENYDAYTNYRNRVLQKWHDRTKTVKDSKNPGGNLNILTKIENALLSKNEMIRKTQVYRGDFNIYGIDNPKETVESDGTHKEVQLPEIFDDSEFYHQMLRELIEYKTNTGENQSEITQKFIELQKVRSRMKKNVDTRASKGRKIRYIVHNKLVNFMPPKDTSEWTYEAKTELFTSLFGLANKSEMP